MDTVRGAPPGGAHSYLPERTARSSSSGTPASSPASMEARRLRSEARIRATAGSRASSRTRVQSSMRVRPASAGTAGSSARIPCCSSSESGASSRTGSRSRRTPAVRSNARAASSRSASWESSTMRMRGIPLKSSRCGPVAKQDSSGVENVAPPVWRSTDGTKRSVRSSFSSRRRAVPEPDVWASASARKSAAQFGASGSRARLRYPGTTVRSTSSTGSGGVSPSPRRNFLAAGESQTEARTMGRSEGVGPGRKAAGDSPSSGRTWLPSLSRISGIRRTRARVPPCSASVS